jgi:hypothetical protein
MADLAAMLEFLEEEEGTEQLTALCGLFNPAVGVSSWRLHM